MLPTSPKDDDAEQRFVAVIGWLSLPVCGSCGFEGTCRCRNGLFDYSYSPTQPLPPPTPPSQGPQPICVDCGGGGLGGMCACGLFDIPTLQLPPPPTQPLPPPALPPTQPLPPAQTLSSSPPPALTTLKKFILILTKIKYIRFIFCFILYNIRFFLK